MFTDPRLTFRLKASSRAIGSISSQPVAEVDATAQPPRSAASRSSTTVDPAQRPAINACAAAVARCSCQHKSGDHRQLYLSVPAGPAPANSASCSGQDPAEDRLPAGASTAQAPRDLTRWRASSPPWLPVQQPQLITPGLWPEHRADRQRDHRHDRQPVAGRPQVHARLFKYVTTGASWKLTAGSGADGYPRQFAQTQPVANASSATPADRTMSGAAGAGWHRGGGFYSFDAAHAALIAGPSPAGPTRPSTPPRRAA